MLDSLTDTTGQAIWGASIVLAHWLSNDAALQELLHNAHVAEIGTCIPRYNGEIWARLSDQYVFAVHTMIRMYTAALLVMVCCINIFRMYNCARTPQSERD